MSQGRSAAKFGPSQAREGAQQHERAVWRVDRGGQVVDLRDGQDWPLRGLFLSSAFDPAGVAADDPVIDSGVEDGFEQAGRQPCAKCTPLP
jgi:hypothetical protein